MDYNYMNWLKIIRKDCELSTDKEFKEIINGVIDKHKLKETIKKGETLYRARIVEDDLNLKDNDNAKRFFGYNKEDSGMAPKSKIKRDGRLNYKGEQVLYLANDQYTALAEVRPEKKIWVSIAGFEILDDIEVINFCNNGYSPKSIMHWISFEFYKPVHNSEYRITQQIGKVIKELGYCGIKYSSCFSAKGVNLALQKKEKKAEAIGSKLYLTESILFYAKEIYPQNSKEASSYKLLPTSIVEKTTEHERNLFFKRMSSSKSSKCP